MFKPNIDWGWLSMHVWSRAATTRQLAKTIFNNISAISILK